MRAGDESRDAAGVEGRLRRMGGRRWGVGARWLVRLGDGVSRLYIVMAPASRLRSVEVWEVLNDERMTRSPAVDHTGADVKHRDTAKAGASGGEASTSDAEARLRERCITTSSRCTPQHPANVDDDEYAKTSSTIPSFRVLAAPETTPPDSDSALPPPTPSVYPHSTP